MTNQTSALAALAVHKPIAIVDGKSLNSAFALAAKVIDKRCAIPIMRNAKLDGNGESLTVTATDLGDMELQSTVEGLADSVFSATVPIATIKPLIKDAAEVSLEHDTIEAAPLAIETGSGRSSLATLPVCDYPIFQVSKFTHSFNIAAGELLATFEQVEFAISTEETRYYLNGVYMHQVGDRLAFVSTDGYRLARLYMAIPDGANGMPGVIIPTKCVKLVCDIIKAQGKSWRNAGTVKVDLSPVHCRFTIGHHVLTSRMVDGTFPDYQRVIPRDHSKLAKLDAGKFAAAIKAIAGGFTKRNAPAIKLTFAETTLNLSVTDPETGTATSSIPCEFLPHGHGDYEFTIGFNSRYLLDICDAMDCDTIEMLLTDAGSPTRLRATDSSEDALLAVLMPMRV